MTRREQSEGRSQKRPGRLLMAVVIMGASWALPAAGQDVIVGPPPVAGLPDWPKKETGKLTISGAALEKPDLHYSLLPRGWETDPGNAAVKYLAAASQLPKLSEEEVQLRELARDAQLDALEERRLSALLSKYGMALRMMHDGARLESVDWNLNLRKEGMTALLPWLSQERDAANALCVEIRLDIKRHDWAAAQDKLQTGYMLARHMGQGQTLIEALVGDAIAGLMNKCVEDWVAEPGSPNLYWPLSNLPAPFTDLRHTMMFEQSFVYFSLPELRQMHEGHFSAEIWNGLVSRFSEVGAAIGGGAPFPGGLGRPAWQKESEGAVMGMAMYPQAKAFLVARGMSREEVEKMPVAEALGRYFVRSFEEEEDDTFKWMGLPPSQSFPGLKQAELELQKQMASRQMNFLAAMVLPSLSRAIQVNAKLDRQIAALRIVEAVRAYAAEKGQLPESLEALTLPVPADPGGGVFMYRKQGDMATFWSPDQENARDSVHYELTLRK